MPRIRKYCNFCGFFRTHNCCVLGEFDTLRDCREQLRKAKTFHLRKLKHEKPGVYAKLRRNLTNIRNPNWHKYALFCPYCRQQATLDCCNAQTRQAENKIFAILADQRKRRLA